MAKRYVHKPTPIEAEQLSASITQANDLAYWCGARVTQDAGTNLPKLHLATFEGFVYVNVGDWVVKDEKGEFSVVSNEDFVKKYTNG